MNYTSYISNITGHATSKPAMKGASTMKKIALLIAAGMLTMTGTSAQAFSTVCKDSADYACWYEGTWVAPDEAAIPNDATGDMIRYGKLVLSETYKYIGQGSSMPYTNNKVSCTNCHVDDGKAAHGQPWAVVWYKYGSGGQGPYSARSNRYLDMKNRIHDCMVRSMNGITLPDDSYEMTSMIEYMKWLGTGLKVADWNLVTPKGASNIAVASISRPADPVRGKAVYEENCGVCHGHTGEGVFDDTAKKYIYPAVWGPNSFNNGAGMYRIRTAVGFIKGNMPYGWANASDATHQLSVEDAWDSMAYVISNDRPIWSGYLTDWSSYRPSDCMPNWMIKTIDTGYGNYFPRVESNGYLSDDLTYPQKYADDKHKYGTWSELSTLQSNMQKAYLAITPRPVYPDCRNFVYDPVTATGTLR